jgi:hypothetical protein
MYYMKTALKTLLRESCLPELLESMPYVHLNKVKFWLTAKGVDYKVTTLAQYMSELTAAGFVHNAGKGWYSSLAQPFTLDTAPVEELNALLVKKFPLLRFAVWSTEQIRHYAHHTLNKFVIFVYVDKPLMRPVYEFLRSSDWNVYLNPGVNEARTIFTVKPKTVVVRMTKAPDALPTDHRLTIEELLIELYQESKRLPIIGTDEVSELGKRVVESARVSMGGLAGAASDRKIDLRAILGDEYSLAENG